MILHENLDECYFCNERFLRDRYGDYSEEVGEFWHKEKQDTVLGHPDCTPLGIETILMEQDPVWSMA